MPAARERVLERLHYQAHRQAYRKITEIAVDVVRQIEHEGHFPEDLSDKPRFLITNARHCEAKRILTSWSYRWPGELFHEFSQPSAGFEAAQVRKEEAVKRHVRLSCVAQTLLQDLTMLASTSEQFDLAEGQITQGQRVRKVCREVLAGVLAFAQQAFNAGKTPAQVREALMPA